MATWLRGCKLTTLVGLFGGETKYSKKRNYFIWEQTSEMDISFSSGMSCSGGGDVCLVFRLFLFLRLHLAQLVLTLEGLSDVSFCFFFNTVRLIRFCS